jgi:hypothetical protein
VTKPKETFMRFVVVLSIVLLALAGIAAANVPARVPVQGFLTDTGGTPIDGPIQIEIRLYDVQSGGTAWYAETQVVTVDNGELTAYVGSVVPLDMTQFRGATPYVGITLAGESEMTPRLALGSVPFAAYSQETAAVPTGAVMMFDLAACPPGWAELTGARGRALVGLPVGGTLAGTVGSALTDLEDRIHSHMVDPAAVTSTMAAAHTHPVPTTSFFTTSSGSHIHNVDPPSTDSESVVHWHDYADFNFTTKDWSSYTAGGAVAKSTIVDWGTSATEGGIHADGAGEYPFQWSSAPGAGTLYTGRNTHDHAVDIGSFSTPTGEGAHTHFIDPPDATAQPAGGHDHGVDIGPTAATPASATMPYLQLLVCRKN